MKNIVYVILGSLILAMGISYAVFKYANKNIPPSIIGMMLVFIYVGISSFFDKDKE